MRRFLKPFLLIGLSVIVVALISYFLIPGWQNLPGGTWLLIGVVIPAVVAVASDLVSILKDFHEESSQSVTTITNNKTVQGNGPATIIEHVDQVIYQTNASETIPPDFKEENAKFPLPARGTLPEPGLLPPGSRMPFLRNAVFTGREADLLKLADGLVYAGHPGRVGITQPQAASGLGGIGKTQLAVEFCYRYGRWSEGVHWLSAANPDEIGAEIAACGQEMGLPNWPEKQDDQITLTLRAWAAAPNRLMVLDNLEEPEALRSWLPKMNGLRVLITTRSPNWPRELGVHVQRLDVLPRTDSRALLCRLAPRLEVAPDVALDLLCERLGDLPLALHLAGCYLDECASCSIQAYLADMDRVGSPLAHDSQRNWINASPTNHIPSLETTFALSWQRLAGDGEVVQLARVLFQTAGYCAPNTPIPEDLLWETVKEDGLERAIFERARYRLVGLGLFTAAEQGPMMHPLLTEYARQMQDEEQAVLKKYCDALARMTNNANNTGLPAQFLSLLAHVEAAASIAETVGVEEAGALWNNLGYHKAMVADFRRARECYQRALPINEQAYGPEDSGVATIVNNLGLVLRDLGDLSGAKECIERAQRIAGQIYGPEHPTVATYCSNLGLVLQALGNLPGAKECYERALCIDEQFYGLKHSTVAIRINNLGSVLQALGDLLDAKECFERALCIDEQFYGPEHPIVAIDVNNLGNVLQDLGDLLGAKECCERALRITEQTYGPEHPTVAIRLNNLGSVLRALGDLPGAKECCERALCIDEQVYGPNHPSTAIDVNNLGSVLRDLGDLLGAKECCKRALRILYKSLPADHPHLQHARRNLEGLEKDLLEWNI